MPFKPTDQFLLNASDPLAARRLLERLRAVYHQECVNQMAVLDMTAAFAAFLCEYGWGEIQAQFADTSPAQRDEIWASLAAIAQAQFEDTLAVAQAAAAEQGTTVTPRDLFAAISLELACFVYWWSEKAAASCPDPNCPGCRAREAKLAERRGRN